jgi:nucleoside-diphosphate-sugar epimerase
MEEAEWMIPYLIRTLQKGEKPSLTACEQRWDYLFATDAAEAIWQTAVSPAAHGVFNLGSGQVYTLRQIVEQIRDNIDPKLPLGFGEVEYRPDQVMHLEADISRLTAATGWAPGTPIDRGIELDVQWHRRRDAWK